MAKYIRIDDDKDFEWLKTVVSNWLNRDPNNHELTINYIYILNWDKYLKNPVNAKEVAESVEEPQVVLTPEDLKKITPKPKPTKSTAKPVKKGGRGKAKGKTAKAKASAKVEPKVVEIDPYQCPEHPTYGARYKPRTDCAKCWDLYKQFHPMDFDKARRSFLASKRSK